MLKSSFDDVGLMKNSLKIFKKGYGKSGHKKESFVPLIFYTQNSKKFLNFNELYGKVRLAFYIGMGISIVKILILSEPDFAGNFTILSKY